MNILKAKIRGQLFRLSCLLFRRRINIGEGIVLQSRLKIKGPGKVIIGKNCHINKLPGDDKQYVTFNTHSSKAVIRIGDSARLSAIRISSKFSVEIGNDFLAEETGIVDTDFHTIERGRGEPLNESYDRCKIKIGDNVAIGAKSILTKGVRIGNNVIVIPGSIVIFPIQDNLIVGGNPAKQLKPYKTSLQFY